LDDEVIGEVIGEVIEGGVEGVGGEVERGSRKRGRSMRE